MTYTRSALFVIFGLALLAFVQQEPGPWQPHDPEHREPPPGWFCSHDAVDPAHVCNCQRTCKEPDETVDPSEDGPPVNEDFSCSVYCHMKHCHCPIKGCP